MKGRVVITPDGQVAVFTDEGTFAGGRDAITQFMQGLNQDLAANGLHIQSAGAGAGRERCG